MIAWALLLATYGTPFNAHGPHRVKLFQHAASRLGATHML